VPVDYEHHEASKLYRLCGIGQLTAMIDGGEPQMTVNSNDGEPRER
jgi:hypothetical protein